MLRVAVMLDEMVVPRWVAAMLRDIQVGNAARIELILVNDAPTPPEPHVLQKLKSRWYALPQAIVRRTLRYLQDHVLDGKPSLLDPFVPEALPAELQGVPVVHLVPHQKQVSDYILPHDVELIRQHDLDVVIRIGFRILRGDILSVARHGVWSLHHGDNRINRGGPAGFWESLEAWPTTGVTLQILNEDLDNGTVLERSAVTTDPWSVHENRANLFWKSAKLIPRKLVELDRLGAEAFYQRVAEHNQHPPFYCRHLYTQPSHRQHALALFRKACARVAHKVLEKSTKSRWILAFDLRQGVSTSFWRFRPILPPSGRYYADPHVLQRGDLYYVYFEDYCRQQQRGRISVLTIDQRGGVSDAVPVLERPYHLSYPFVFDWQGETFMIPESGANKTVELYRCVQFPDRWEHVMNLMEGIHLVDVTLHHDGTRWWLFAGLAESPRGSFSDELVLYSADDFRTTEWVPHPYNPVSGDVTHARPAGGLLQLNNQLYRPAQNCSYHYGYGLQFCQIEQLTPTQFRQRVAASVTPSWRPDVISTHTFNHVGRLTIIDAELRDWRWARWW